MNSTALNFTFSFFVGMFLMVYVLNLPGRITGQQAIVNEYYYAKYTTNIPLDFLFVIGYLLVAYYVAQWMGVTTFMGCLLVVAGVTVLLTAGFCWFFLSLPLNPDNFFSRWFHTVGYSAIVYDVVLLCFIYILFDYMNRKLI